MSEVRSVSERGLCVLPVVRHGDATDVSELRPGSGAWVVELSALRNEIGVIFTGTT